MEAEGESQELSEQEDRECFEHLMPPAVKISDLDDRLGTDKFDAMAFELFKETASVLIVCASSYIAHAEQDDVSYPRNQAICIGLLVRVVKFMRAILALISHGDHLGEVILALLRCLGESATSLRYLILKHDEALFEEFVRTALGPDRELYDFIKTNISKRNGQTLPVEERMLRSIDRTCRLSGMSIDDINGKHTQWGGGFRNRLTDLEIEAGYLFFQRLPSHAVHGTWSDLVLHHLEERPNGFAPRFETAPVDSRQLLPICLVILVAAKDYVEHYLQGMAPLIKRISDLSERIWTVNEAHEKSYQR